MADSPYDVAVIGAGPGGYAAAFQAADLGLRTVLIDDDQKLGGTCLLRGCIPSKALLHAARLITDAEEARAWGIEFGKPKVDLEALSRRLDAIVGKLTKGVQTLAGSRKVEVIRARAAFKNATTLTLTGAETSRELRFGHAIIASGSRPVMAAQWRNVAQRYSSVIDTGGSAGDGQHWRPGLGRHPSPAPGRWRRVHRLGAGYGVSRARI